MTKFWRLAFEYMKDKRLCMSCCKYDYEMTGHYGTDMTENLP